MPAPGRQFQPVLPGLGRIKRAAPKAVGPVMPHPINSGPVPGQLVMGVKDLARGRAVEEHRRVPITSGPMVGGTRLQVRRQPVDEHYEVDPHGYVQEGYGQAPHHDEWGGGVHGGMTHAAELYGTHGGRYAATLKEALAKEGGTASEWGITARTAQVHDRQVRAVKAHWNRQPVVQFPTSQLVHSTQMHEQTEGDAEATGMAPEGRARIDAIKNDLAKGGGIRKPIWMTKVNGRFFQLDGHHRMVAAREKGLSHVPVRLLDQDAERG